MERNIKISIGIFFALALSRLIPHPPNFTSLIALSFYIPAIFGRKFIPSVMLCFLITDIFIGFHNTLFFTWGSVILIGLMSKFFLTNIVNRVSGALLGACLFYLITNFGVWSLGSYGYTLEGLVACYTLAIPFFAYSLISTFIFAGLIETISKLNIIKFINFKNI